jgi:hypothetical protein
MPLSPDEKAERARTRMLETAKQYGPSTYARKHVSPLFQKMIRAEFAANNYFSFAIVEGEFMWVDRRIGECVCITCGKIEKWDSGIKGMHTGHFLASRRNSILFDEDNVAPECSHCNFYLSGNPQAFRKWMIEVRGIETVERLERLKTQSVSFTLEQLVDMRISYKARLDAAIATMAKG